ARLGGSDGRCRALEASLTQCEAAKRETEAKLSSIAHALRRVCGVQSDGSVHAAARRRVASPARRYSPHRGRDHSEDRNEIIDVDPELIKKGMRNLMHDVCQIEREKKQLKEATEQQGKGDNKLQSITSNLRSLQDEKAKLLSACGQKDAQLNALEQQDKGDNKLQSITSNLRSLQDEKAKLLSACGQKDAQLNALEQQGEGDNKLQSITLNLRSLQDEKATLLSACGQKNAQLNALTVEISNLRDKITSLEATLSSINEEKVQNENKGENLRLQLAERVQEVGQLREALAAAEGRAARLDVRRAQLEGDIQRAAVGARDRDQALKRCEGYSRTIAQLEDRCTSLKGTVEQLSTALQKAATAESELRSELSKESNSDSELERELHSLQRERSELKAKNDALLDTVRKLEADRRMRPSLCVANKHNVSGPESTKDSSRYKDAGSYKDSNIPCKDKGFVTDLSFLEIENRELKMKIRRLEKELGDKESELALARNRYLSDLSTAGGSGDAESMRRVPVQLQVNQSLPPPLVKSILVIMGAVSHTAKSLFCIEVGGCRDVQGDPMKRLPAGRPWVSRGPEPRDHY
ncbi:Rootletin, partial [Operophtera brumata]